MRQRHRLPGGQSTSQSPEARRCLCLTPPSLVMCQHISLLSNFQRDAQSSFDLRAFARDSLTARPGLSHAKGRVTFVSDPMHTHTPPEGGLVPSNALKTAGLRTRPESWSPPNPQPHLCCWLPFTLRLEHPAFPLKPPVPPVAPGTPTLGFGFVCGPQLGASLSRGSCPTSPGH